MKVPPHHFHDDYIAARIEELRGGKRLSGKRFTCVIEGIVRQFKSLADTWGGEIYTMGAQVHTCEGELLRFDRRGQLWDFFRVLECDGVEQEFQLSESGAEFLVRALDALPALEASLIENADARRDELLAAFDKMSGHVERAQIKRQAKLAAAEERGE